MKKVLILIFFLAIGGCSWFSDTSGYLWGGNPNQVTVIKGDTLYSLSKKYNVPLRDMIEANNLRPPYALRIGQTLRMPNAKTHIVAKGDTLYNISKRYNVDVTSLSRTNNIRPPYTLSIGQRLALPGSVSSSGSYAAASSAPSGSSYSAPKSNTYKEVQVSKYRKDKFSWPVKGAVISKFGVIAKGRNNDGINIRAPKNANVLAADKGTVAYAGNELKGFGNLILIKHDDGWVTAYAHNDKFFVKKGQRVGKGEKISSVGTSGGVNEPQLHFETRAGKKAYNPLAYLP